jgi:hypothetical protein
MMGPLDNLRKSLARCRLAAANAEQEAARAHDVRAQESYALLAEGWTGLADDLEHRLIRESKK